MPSARVDDAALHDEPLIDRRELEAMLFGIADIRKNVAEIRRLMEEEDDDGEEPEEEEDA